MYDLVIKNASLVGENTTIETHICINNGLVSNLLDAGHPVPDCSECFDAKGYLVFPGIIDAHAHIGEPDGDDENEYVSCATRAAALGGITTCIDMPLNIPSVLNKTILGAKIKKTLPLSYVDLAMWGALVPENLDSFQGLLDSGVYAFKGFMPSAGWDYNHVDSFVIHKALKQLAQVGGMAGFHCEDYNIIEGCRRQLIESKLDSRRAVLDSRPLAAEKIAVYTVLELARETGSHVHICHVSHPEVAKMIKNAKNHGINVTSETCAHYLLFDENDYLNKGARFLCSPPLREPSAKEKLWEYVLDGTIDCVVSDHSAWTMDYKDDDRPAYEAGFGISGIQNMFQVMFDEIVNKRNLKPSVLTKFFCTNPARIFHINSQKGFLDIGCDADLIIVDPEKEWLIDEKKLEYRQKYSAYNGFEGYGMPIHVYLRGKKIVDNGNFISATPSGKYISSNL